ncbi:hypothetical protein [Allomesorhizobium alhagi]|uniref:Uncharacterized protein n=1 Tax=Mesorhizobium alhagi CCNWXJ12-2 TaxID=1107882 RepID=H0HR02_9HYPH|nr:hypothetical protein [Mesorhizobium alhagi]EHK56864.1 hypothetical protein MAXJ12_12922 [Mesorhizobium alhagi CCNWXJ12-2]
MIRVTFEMLPRGNADKARTIGIMEIANVACYLDGTADYAVILKKTPPFSGALDAAWKKGKLTAEQGVINGVMAGEDEETITALAQGHHRTQRGVYDLLYRALKACGLDRRNP